MLQGLLGQVSFAIVFCVCFEGFLLTRPGLLYQNRVIFCTCFSISVFEGFFISKSVLDPPCCSFNFFFFFFLFLRACSKFLFISLACAWFYVFFMYKRFLNKSFCTHLFCISVFQRFLLSRIFLFFLVVIF